ncbi:response regulator [Jatrophihabitans endophyticus]|uniref:response regulator n=1 Tax=Jatrophihabitans endophyticus TaxID=1206085 RepID=UPI0019F295C3|nr:response regulator [Jatrophihabitans endophyticus]MBE7189899.1 response regulator [Jatrophihabitans endophyticus]
MPNPQADPTTRRPLGVLLVEDDPGDVVIAQEALAAGGIDSRLSIVSDGVAAMQFLRRENGYAGAERPDLILLDLNLPKMSGHEVLTEVKTDPDLRSIPVVVLTTSSNVEDVARSYDRYANAFVTKPVDFEQFTRVVKQIDDFFAQIVELPPST